MTHPAIKAALDFVEGQIIGYETRLELGGSLSCTEEIIKQSAEQTLAQLRALEGCVVIERGELEGMKKQPPRGIHVATDNRRQQEQRIGWNDCIDSLVAAQMKGE